MDPKTRLRCPGLGAGSLPSAGGPGTEGAVAWAYPAGSAQLVQQFPGGEALPDGPGIAVEIDPPGQSQASQDDRRNPFSGVPAQRGEGSG